MRSDMKLFLRIVSCLWLCAPACFASDLLQIYHQALLSAPGLQSNLKLSQAGQLAAPIARGSALPVIVGSGVWTTNKTNGQGYYDHTGSLTVTQAVFSPAVWMGYSQANKSAEAASARYQSQFQQFILTVVTSYFSVRENQERVLLDQSNVSFLKQTLSQTQKKFEVGISTITDVRQAEADYDRALAQMIRDQSALAASQDKLAKLTGAPVQDLAGLNEKYPFGLPAPASIDEWVSLATHHNCGLKYQAALEAAQYRAVLVAGGNMMPNVNLVWTYTAYHTNAGPEGLAALGIVSQNARDQTIALDLTWTPFASFALFNKTRQAADVYDQQQALFDQAYRSLVSQTRQDYLAVQADLSKVAAYREAVKASQASLNQYQEQYKVGTQTIVGVLNALTNLFAAQQNLVEAKYTYISDLLQLHLDAGDLSEANLKQINAYLK